MTIENAKEEALVLVQEECAEVIQILSKIKRWGEESYHPKDPDKKTNLSLLVQELGDLHFTIYLLCRLYGISDEQLANAAGEKAVNMLIYTKYLKHEVMAAVAEKDLTKG